MGKEKLPKLCYTILVQLSATVCVLLCKRQRKNAVCTKVGMNFTTMELVKRKDCIREFVTAWGQYDTQNPVGILRITQDPGTIWTRRFKEAGYYHVDLTTPQHWNKIHEWCREQYGPAHYFSLNTTWQGGRFWFETERDAVLFSLRWL